MKTNVGVYLLVVLVTSLLSSSSASPDHHHSATTSLSSSSSTGTTLVDDDVVVVAEKLLSVVDNYANRKLALIMLPRGPQENCIGLGESCNKAPGYWCCEGLLCNGVIYGECVNDAYCKPRGHSCGTFTYPGCCWPMSCNDASECN